MSFLNNLMIILLFFLCVATATGRGAAAKPFDDGAYAAQIHQFYTARDNALIWNATTSGRHDADLLLKELQNSWTHGLNPENYRIEFLRAMLSGKTDLDALAIDMSLTAAALQYVIDLSGYVNKNESGAVKQVEDFLQSLSDNDIISVTENHAPDSKFYRVLRSELVNQVNLHRQGAMQIKVKGLIKPGESSDAIPLIRGRLGLGDNESLIYDDALAASIMTFQKENGLVPDGIIGPKVMAILNRSPADKINQIIVNMERLRWRGGARPEKYILVNVPSATLWAVEGGRSVIQMPVIVGRAARPTQIFEAQITGVRFNPTWTVPPTIKKKDFLPMLREDPFAMTRRGIDMYYEGNQVDPSVINWGNVREAGIVNVRMVQQPGPTNPLGRIRIIMPNQYDIYLHDTNAREVFDTKDRTMSSGCIRLSDPEAIAMFILKENVNWNRDKMQRLIEAGKTIDIMAANKIPVYLTYQTLWHDESDKVLYGEDIYGFDRSLLERIRKNRGIHIPSKKYDGNFLL